MEKWAGRLIGHDFVGSGALGIIVLHDWMCDTTTWRDTRDYLDGDTFTWMFTDLRGYGRSRAHRGDYTLAEAVTDLLELADEVGFDRFAVIGHSMSSLIALHLAQHHPDRVRRAVVLTPPPPTGFGADAATLEALQGTAHGDDERRMRTLKAMWGDRLSEHWMRFKVRRWRMCAEAEAVAGYATMFARDGLPDPTAKIAVPVLAVTGEQDAEIMRKDAVTRLLSPLCDRLIVESIADAGHYPMQETPPLLVAAVERFLAEDAVNAGA
jgi:pimeloyl-ACP methyl ester carboxylesterase